MDTGGTRDIVVHEQTGLLSDSAAGPGARRRALIGRPALAAQPGRGRTPARRTHVRRARRDRARRAGSTPTSSRGAEARVADPSAASASSCSADPFYGLHGFGGLERHLYDLVRHHLAEGWRVTVITRTPREPAGVDPARWRDVARASGLRRPLRGRIARSRSRAAPARRFWTGARRTRGLGGAPAASPRIWSPRARADIVYGVGASVWGYAARADAVAPVRRWSSTRRGSRSSAASTASYGGQRAQERRLRAAARGGARLRRRRSDAVIATDQAHRAQRPAAPARRSADRVRPDSQRHRRRATCDRLVDPAAGRRGRARRPASPTTRRCSSASAASRPTRDSATWPRRSAHGASNAALAMGAGGRRPGAPEPLEATVERLRIRRPGAPGRTRRRPHAARLVRGGRPLRAPDALRRQLAGHARGDAAPPARGRHARRRPARQGAARAAPDG